MPPLHNTSASTATGVAGGPSWAASTATPSGYPPLASKEAKENLLAAAGAPKRQEELSQRLEQERLAQIKSAAWSMKGELVAGGRCPKCTLKPPCKHYSDVGEMLSDPAALPPPPKKSPKKRDVLLPELHASGTDMSSASLASPPRVFGGASPIKKQAQIA